MKVFGNPSTQGFFLINNKTFFRINLQEQKVKESCGRYPREGNKALALNPRVLSKAFFHVARREESPNFKFVRVALPGQDTGKDVFAESFMGAKVSRLFSAASYNPKFLF